MNGTRIILLCAAFAVIGFIGGRWTGSAEAQREAIAESNTPRGRTPGSRHPDAADSRPSKSAARTRRPPARVATGNPTVDLAREMIDSWNDQEVDLPGGDNTELLLFDLTKFSRLMGSLERINDPEIAQLRGSLLPEDDDSFEADILKTTAAMMLAAREIELHGSSALDGMINRAMADPDEAEIEDIMPAMIYTLALQDPTAAEKWLGDISRRPDIDDFIDLEEMKAALEKGKTAR